MRRLASSNNEGHKIGLYTPAPWHNCYGWLGIKNQFSVYLYSPNWVLTWQSPLLGRLSCQSWQGSSSGRTAGRRRCRTATSRCQHSHSSPRPAGAHQTPKKERETQNVSCCFHSNSHQTPRTKRQTQNLSRCLHSNSYQTNVIVLSTVQLHADSHMPNALGKECGEGGWGKMKIRGLGWESWGGSKSLANLAREPGDQEIKKRKEISASTRRKQHLLLLKWIRQPVPEGGCIMEWLSPWAFYVCSHWIETCSLHGARCSCRDSKADGFGEKKSSCR